MNPDSVVYPFKPAILSDYKGDLSKKWYVNYYVWSEQKGELVRKRGTFNQRTAAERYKEAAEFIKIINEALNQGYVVDPIESESPDVLLSKKTPLRVAFDVFLDIRGKTIDDNTLRGYKKDIKVFIDWASEATISDTNKKMVSEMSLESFSSNEVFRFSDYIDRRVTNKLDKEGNIISSKVGVAKKTYSNYIATLRTVFSFIIERKVLKENPFLDVKKRKGASSQHIPYAPNQVREFKKVCLEKLGDEQLWLFVNFIYYGFFRPREEAQSLQIKHILKRTIIVPGEIAKNNQTEHIRIPKALEALIQQYKTTPLSF